MMPGTCVVVAELIMDRVRAGHTERFELIDCDAPVIVSVAVHDCGPVPSGGATPGEMFTAEVHCVPPGSTTLLSGSCIKNDPAESSVTRCVAPLICTPFSVAPPAPRGSVSVASS